MGQIIKKNGYAYLVEGNKGFETWFNLGKIVEEEAPKPKKRKKKGEEK